MLEASRDYLPPNSYAPARVIVGVDAAAGVQSQTDPLPVVLRITGPAEHDGYSPKRVIVLTDKPQKPFPETVWLPRQDVAAPAAAPARAARAWPG